MELGGVTLASDLAKRVVETLFGLTGSEIQNRAMAIVDLMFDQETKGYRDAITILERKLTETEAAGDDIRKKNAKLLDEVKRYKAWVQDLKENSAALLLD